MDNNYNQNNVNYGYNQQPAVNSPFMFPGQNPKEQSSCICCGSPLNNGYCPNCGNILFRTYEVGFFENGSSPTTSDIAVTDNYFVFNKMSPFSFFVKRIVYVFFGLIITLLTGSKRTQKKFNPSNNVYIRYDEIASVITPYSWRLSPADKNVLIKLTNGKEYLLQAPNTDYVNQFVNVLNFKIAHKDEQLCKAPPTWVYEGGVQCVMMPYYESQVMTNTQTKPPFYEPPAQPQDKPPFYDPTVQQNNAAYGNDMAKAFQDAQNNI